ncbi:MAG: ATP-binding protein, partial [Myxococcota bacterium]
CKRSFEPLARQAMKESWSYETYLYEVLTAEAESRAESAIRQRIHAARFPEVKTLGEFDFDSADGVDREKMADSARDSASAVKTSYR